MDNHEIIHTAQKMKKSLMENFSFVQCLLVSSLFNSVFPFFRNIAYQL